MATVKELKGKIEELEKQLLEMEDELQEKCDVLAEIHGLSWEEGRLSDDEGFDGLSEHAATLAQIALTFIWGDGDLTREQIKVAVAATWTRETGGSAGELYSALAEITGLEFPAKNAAENSENSDQK